ncbi:MAG: flavin reductase family protein [Lentisphaeraceae bacterium]|nr:flavin reductase family protein [Lentisphaeraceae bacterium]
MQTVLPRPIAWLLSDNGDDSLNLSYFSYFNGVSSRPPFMSLSIGLKQDGADKDTRRNINSLSHFVLHVPHVDQAQLVTESAVSLAHGDSELDKLSLETVEQQGFALPRIKDCRIAYFCELEKIIDVGEVPQALVLARIKAIYVDDEIGESVDGRLSIDISKLNPLARLGGSDYAELGRIFTVK